MSPFPDSFQGNGYLFAGALFALILMSCFAIVLGSVFAKQIHADRREGWSLSNVVSSIFVMICSAMLIRCAPESVWMISYAELSHGARNSIANVKRFLDLFALFPVAVWMGLTLAYKDQILLKLKAPTARIWNDYPLTPLKRVLPLAVLCFAFAAMVTIGRAYS